MKIITIIGARPQFIKASVVSSAIQRSTDITEVMVHTGQHYDSNMSDVFFHELGIEKPAYNLDVHGGNHGSMTGRMLLEIEKVVIEEEPDVLLVYGDTNSTLAGALAAVKLHIPVAHVEAGLRSFNMRMPEEVNRILTDRISSWLFAPTTEAVFNLHKEGLSKKSVYNVGDVMYDVALHHGKRSEELAIGVLEKLGLSEGRYILATIHRAENSDNPERLKTIVDALISVSKELPIIWPLHPRTRNLLRKYGYLAELTKCIHLVDPLGYLEMVFAERHAALIVTDSGGVQKEAFFHKVPCVTLRNETEWVELIESGWNTLVPPVDMETIKAAIMGGIGRTGEDIRPYGSGDASAKIVEVLEEFS